VKPSFGSKGKGPGLFYFERWGRPKERKKKFTIAAVDLRAARKEGKKETGWSYYEGGGGVLQQRVII